MKRSIILTLMTFAFVLPHAKAMDGIYEYENGNKLVRTKQDITFYMTPEKFRREFGMFPPNIRRGELVKIFTEKEVHSPQHNNCRLSTKMSKTQFDGEARKLGKFKFKPSVAPAPVKPTPVVKTQKNPINKFLNKLFNPLQTKRDVRATKRVLTKRGELTPLVKKPAPVANNKPIVKKPAPVAKNNPPVNKVSPLQTKRDARAAKRILAKREQPTPTVKKPTPVANNQTIGQKPTPVAKNNPPVSKVSPLQTKRDARAAQRVLSKRGELTPLVKKPTPIAKKQPTPIVKNPTPVVKKQPSPVNKRAIRIAKRILAKKKPAPVVKKQPAPTRKRAIRFQRNRNRK